MVCKMFQVLLRRMCILLLLDRVFCRCLIDLVGLLCCSGPFFLLSIISSIIESRVLNSPTLVLKVSISPFNSVKFSGIFWWFDGNFLQLLILKLLKYIMPSYISVTFSDLKFIFSDISLTPPTLFWLLFACNVSFYPFTFTFFGSLHLGESCRWYIVGFFFFFFWSILSIPDFCLES